MYNYLFKYILVGCSGTGKTSLIYKYSTNKFNLNYQITIGVDFAVKKVNIDNKVIKLQLWDTAGQEIFRSIIRSYYRNTAGILLCYDVNDRKSFNELPKWLSDVREMGSDNITIILVGNKIDREYDRAVPTDEGKKFADENELLFIETSAKKNINVTECFDKLTTEIYNKLINEIIDINDEIGIKIGYIDNIIQPDEQKRRCC